MADGPQLLPEHPFHYTAQHYQLQQRHGCHGGLEKNGSMEVLAH